MIRRAVRTCLALTVLVAASSVAAVRTPLRAADDPAPREAERVSQEQIDRSVERGVRWLSAEQSGDGSFGSVGGETSLALWALRHSGVPKDASACLRAAAHLEREMPDGTTYGDGLAICALLAQDEVKHRPRIEKLVAQLVKGQCENGQWSYLCAKSGRTAGDNSNTQVALLGLGAAARRGFTVPPETLRRALACIESGQNEDGGWGYAKSQGAKSYHAMTAGSLMGWALARTALREPDAAQVVLADEPQAKRALAWLGAHWVLIDGLVGGKAKGAADWPYYWLWSLERCCGAAGIDRVAAHDWYQEGCAALLARQSDKGRWSDSRPVCDTSWALLFLQRGMRRLLDPATTPAGAAAGPVTPSGDGTPPPPPAAGK